MSKAGMMADPEPPPFLSPADVRARKVARALPLDDLVLDLLPWGKAFASAPISKFPVGAVALGTSGALYAGANLEFPGESLSFTVHAEQAAVYNAWSHGEAGLSLIASTATPCGFCRQFLNELPSGGALRVLLPGHAPTTLGALLPESFGPSNVGPGGHLMQPSARSLIIAETAASGGPPPSADPVTAAALAAASAAYAPYSGTCAGVGLRTADGCIFHGRYAENAAFNPSLSPLQGALIALALAGGSVAALDDAVLVEAFEPATGRSQHGASQLTATTALLAAVAPNVRLRYLRADFDGNGRHGAGL